MKSGSRILVAGASGGVGREVVPLAVQAGLHTRTLSRSAGDIRADATDSVAIRGVCDGMDAVISCVGASVSPSGNDKRRYSDVDTIANRNLIAEARRAGVAKFVYVAAHLEPACANAAYFQAHEAVVAGLAQSGLDYTIVRPTGIFSAFGDFIKFARKGFGTVIGDGSARTNPVHPADVAQACIDGLTPGSRQVSIGGPGLFTRREIVEAAFLAVGRQPRVFSIPAAVIRGGAKAMGVFNPRLGELFEFVTAVSIADCIAPRVGTRRLEEYFQQLAGSDRS